MENFGLRVATVPDLATLLATPPDGPARPNVLQLPAAQYDPGPDRPADVAVRPTLVHWVSPVDGGAEEVLRRQSLKQRQLGRAGRRALAQLPSRVVEPIDPELYAEWLGLYTAHLARLRMGRNLAGFYRRSVTDPASGHGMVVWRRGGRIAAGLVYRVDQGLSALIGRYLAVDPGEVGADLPRGVYLSIVDMARDRGLRWATLGSDVNFYGAFVGAGLCAHKLRLGFWPVPADLMGRADCHDVAERVVDLTGLEPPVLRFEYRAPRDPVASVEDFVGPALSLVSVTPPGFASPIFDGLPEHRRLVL